MRPTIRCTASRRGGFFHGYYDCYCYLPLYVFCGRHLLAAKLRRANIDAAAGAVEEVARIVAQICRRWPLVRILLRADSGFAREELMAWCEANGVHFLFGLAKTDRLIAEIKAELEGAAAQSRRTGKPARRFKDFRWMTRSSWSCQRRVVAKAEWTKDEANPRFVVTSLTRAECKARYLYEKVYCARGDMENRIKECQLDLYADRTSTATMRANQLRLWFASMAYVLLCALRRIALHHTPFAKATAAPFVSSCSRSAPSSQLLRAKRCAINNSANSGSSWITRVMSTFAIRTITHSVIAETVARRSGCPVKHPSPKKSPVPRSATTASLPCSEMTVFLTLPL